MDLVNLMYRYINRFINIDELIVQLKNIDLTKYNEKEIEHINKLIEKIEEIKNNIPNEIDEVEKRRIESVNKLLKIVEGIDLNKYEDEEGKEFIKKHQNQLLKEKSITKDGGELYKELFELLTNDTLIDEYFDRMNDEEFLEFLTQYISVPITPNISQEEFNNLVHAGIKKDERESLWRLAFNYNNKNMDFSLIEDYFILKRDGYYLIELICAVSDDLNISRIIEKVEKTKDREFIIELANRGKDFSYLFTEDEIKKVNKIISDLN